MSRTLEAPKPGTALPVRYNLTHDDGDPSSITVFFPNQVLPQVATADHKAFSDIVDACKKGEDPESISELFNVGKVIVKRFNRVTERVSIAHGQLFFDGDPIDSSLSTMILAFYAEGHESFEPLVSFFEKLQANPNKHSREMLYGWMSKHKFGIMPDGDFVAYKGVHRNGTAAEDLYRSGNHGRASVNGEVHEGAIPTSPGVVVEMPRSEVNHNPSVGCSTGLHAGDWSYASSFATVTLRVKINPRDVVSVPTDCGERKMRVCRYRVLGPVTTFNGNEPEGLFHPDDELRTLAMEAVEPEAVAQSRAEGKTRGKKNRAGRVAATAKRATRKLKELKFPRYYEEFTVKHFRKVEFKRLQWLAREWEVKVPAPRSHELYAKELAKEASKKRRESSKYSDLKPSEKRKIPKADKPTTTKVG